MIEVLTVIISSKIAVSLAAVGNSTADAVDELLDRVLALTGLEVAVEVLA